MTSRFPEKWLFNALCYQILALQICDCAPYGSVVELPGFVCELHVSGYKFSVLNNAFVVHQGLKTASSFHKDKDVDQERNRVLFRQFKLELREKYPDSSRRCY